MCIHYRHLVLSENQKEKELTERKKMENLK